MTTVTAPPAWLPLHAVPDLGDTTQAVQHDHAEVTRLMVRYAVGAPLDELVPQAVIDRLEDLNAMHETGCDRYDNATRNLEAARRDLAEAARRLTEAEEAWRRRVPKWTRQPALSRRRVRLQECD
jgi:hypothetical protein